MASTSPGYGITIRVDAPASAQPVSEITQAILAAGASITALDVVESVLDRVVIDVTCDAIDAEHAEAITAALSENKNLNVRKVSDRTFLLHLGGKIEIASKVPLKTRDDLSRAYTPGVARICQAIAKDPSDLRRLTIKRNTVAVVTDGSAVLGLGNIGPGAALPVMEGKAALFKRFADVDAWPVCLDTQDVEEIIRTVQIIAPVYGGINLEDISAPRCFEIEARLRDLLDIPVFHDDQHGTAIVVLAALTNALKLVKKDLKSTKIVLSGVGAAGTAVARLLIANGAKNIIGFGKDGLIFEDKGESDPMRKWFVENCSPGAFRGDLSAAMKGADVFIGLSAPNVLVEADIKSMAKDAIVFALANPDPEIDPALARKHAAVVATGRSDHPNQINNVLAFPGIFRGLLDAHITKITDNMLVLAAEAIASCVSSEQLNANFIVPSVFDPTVSQKVAAAVKKSV
ncbi:malate dehydrogenase (oxaloacetate-decarboxylating) [Candidatus Nanopelagicus hibericus]|uniref:Malate dehydrogenase (Oxaloacetate-decarboxylating) n=1 Tax=Candidatus Nanopelagicus hibericus TaxID=1884915 RepID=A0A249KAK7_9ACTN|nr:NAD-dependent malic enzyme [Candidatus Nanopelagicus hibericus]ASY13833.1 malate dehydrogenase (oxaloacetate-decarboxylating) [Candidatus Nanopelagicus hibericus]